MTHNNNNIIAWAKETGKKLRLSTYDMTGEEGWLPLVYADNDAGAVNKAKNEEQTTGGKVTPSPGSPKATDQGCTCPVFDNCKGRGYGITDKDGKPLYYINEKCPLHVAKEGEKE